MLELKGIHKYYNPGTVNEMCLFQNFNLTIDKGEFVSVVGSNGSGKTSMLYIMASGNDQIVLCERGIRTYETATRNTLDLSVIPVLHERTHLPVVIDPSHATGVARYVPAMAAAAAAAGADGLMVEVHNNPAAALCDGPQSITPDTFEELCRRVEAVRTALAVHDEEARAA